MSEPQPLRDRVRLDALAHIDPDALSEATNPKFRFKYIDISCASNGKLALPAESIEFGDAPSRARKILKDGDVIVSTVRPNLKAFAYCRLVGEPYIASTGFAVLRAKDNVDAYFLLSALLSDDLSKQIESHAVGSNYPAINSSDVRRLQIPAFAPETQRAIGRVLAAIDTTIEKTEALIAKYQQIKAGLMNDLFTRGVLPNGQLRPPRSDAPELYQKTNTGWAPLEWDVKTLGSACDWYSGGTPSKRNEEWWKGTLPWLSPKDMKCFELDDTEDHVTRLAAILGSRIAPEGSVFVVVRGMILAHSFPVVVNGKEFAFNQDVKAVIGHPPLKNRYLAYWFVANADLMLKKTTESTHGTKRFDLGDLYKISIGVPSDAEQERIISRLDVINRRVQSEIAQCEKLKIKKRGLMQDLLTGKVSVAINEKEGAFV